METGAVDTSTTARRGVHKRRVDQAAGKDRIYGDLLSCGYHAYMHVHFAPVVEYLSLLSEKQLCLITRS